MADTGIEYGNKAWNPISGCSPVSEGCFNCWAKRMSKRQAGRNGYPADEPFKVTLHKNRLDEPYHWKKPRRILVSFMGDLFHEDVPFLYIAMVFGTMHTAKQHTYMILTKRPQRMKEFLEWFVGPEWRGAWPHEFSHVWLGVTAENQQRYDERTEILRQIPAALHFVSIEPMLGPIVMRQKAKDEREIIQAAMMGLLDEYSRPVAPGIDWVICGGESGPCARPMHPNWVRSLRDQCQAAGVPFYFKQWGEWFPYRPSTYGYYMPLEGMGTPTLPKRVIYKAPWEIGGEWRKQKGVIHAFRIGKKKAGRLLDGRTWEEMPGVEA